MNELNRHLDPGRTEDGERSPEPARTQLGLPPTFLGPAAFWTPDRLVESAWLGHIPFAFWLTVALRPRVLVELGTHTGASYCAFCQAIKHASLGTLAYAVDTWEGDEHAGYYGDDVYDELAGYIRAHYGAFSQLLRSKFDDSLQYFNDSEIDLLHIDGLHTYDAVRHDFDAWLPKLSDRGVVLLHDINVRERNFGVWRLWHELAQQYPSFAFQHQHGLGIVRVGRERAPELDRLLAAASDPQLAAVWRNGFARLGQAIEERWAAGVQASYAAALAGERASLEQRLAQRESENRRLGKERSSLETRLADGEAENRRLNASVEELTAAAAKLTAAQDRTRQIESEHALLADERDAVQRELDRHKHACDTLARELGKHRRRRQKMKQFWLRRATRPIRAVAAMTLRPFKTKKPIHAGRQLTATATPPHLRSDAVKSKPESHTTDATELRSYQKWIDHYDTLTDSDRALIHKHIQSLDLSPLISIVMPTYNTKESQLRQAIESVRSQLYPHWELCIADDASTMPHIRQVLASYSGDPRIKTTYREKNGHIAAASNTALQSATGEFVALMDHDDILPEHALYEVAVAINNQPNVDLIYSDEDRIDNDGKRLPGYFKPDWDPDLLLTHNLISHLGVYRRSRILQIHGFREGFEGSQDYDLALRFVRYTSSDNILHIPKVLYHWRVNEDSSYSNQALDRCVRSARRAIKEYLKDQCIDATVEPSPTVPSYSRIQYHLRDPRPLVSVVIPTRDQAPLLANCTDGLLRRTNYDNLELVIVDNGSSEPDALRLLAKLSDDPRVTVLPYPGEFNYSAMNNAATKQTTGSLILLYNNDIEVIDENWLEEMVSHVVRPAIGAVGAKLLYPDGKVQHAGVALGVGGCAAHIGAGAPGTHPGYFGLLTSVRTVSAVTAACLLVRRHVFDEVGGLDSANLKVAFNDVDFCLRIRDRGYRNLFTPYAVLCHHESVSRGQDDTPEKAARFASEVRYMQIRWKEELFADPYYGTNFDLGSVNFELAFPPRQNKSWISPNSIIRDHL